MCDFQSHREKSPGAGLHAAAHARDGGRRGGARASALQRIERDGIEFVFLAAGVGEAFHELQDLGDGLEERLGHEFADFAFGVEGARERDVLHERDALGHRRLADRPGDEVRAGHDDAGQGILRRVEADADRQVRRVGDDDVRLLRRLHGIGSVQELVAELPLRLLHLLRALHLLVFALHLVLGHHHFLGEVLPLEDAVDDGDEDVARGGVDGEALEHDADRGHDVVHRAVAHLQQLRNRCDDDLVEQPGEEPDLHAVLEELEEVLFGKDLLGALGRIELGEVRLERLEGEEEADLDDVRDDADHGRDDHEDERVFEDQQDRQRAAGGDGAVGGSREPGPDCGDQLLRLDEQRAAHPRQHGEEDHQEGRRDDVLALAHLPLLPRVAQLLRGGHFGFFAA